MHQFGAGTHIGQRDNNEDSYVCDEENALWVVADGMGGLGFGEVASAISTYTVETQIRQGHGVNQAIELAHQRIQEYAESEAIGTNMGTTLVLLLSQGSLYNVFWVGDSRAYLYDGNLIRLTVDHSLVQSLIEDGELTEEQAAFDPRKNAVTRALGVQQLETVRADSVSDKWKTNQKILLCSDGLTDCISDEIIESIIAQGANDQETVDKLIARAVEDGAKDNITAVLISAPATTVAGDGDTHVPANTYAPEEDTLRVTKNEKQRYQGLPETNLSRQPEIPLLQDVVNAAADGAYTRNSIETPYPLEDTSPVSSTASWLDWQRWLSAATLALTVILFATLTTADKEALRPGLFAGGALVMTQEAPTKTTMIRRKIPDIDLPMPGEIIQIGIFSRLEGAETRQRELSQIGLLPYVEKQLDGNDILYSVLLGPFHQAEEKSAIIARLKRGNINYFERQGTKY